MDSNNPPLMATYKHLLDSSRLALLDDEFGTGTTTMDNEDEECCFLPLIDLSILLQRGDDDDATAAAEQCRASIVRAASEWGFFQVTNHGVPQELLDSLLRQAQVAVFRRPFHLKAREPLLHFSPESYRWGTPTATSLDQLSWSEAYHIPMTTTTTTPSDKTATISTLIEEASTAMSELAQRLAGILIADVGGGDEAHSMRCTRRDTCFLRLNRYPPCAAPGGAYGLCPHTDSDFLTILHQDGVGGLQLLKAGRWLAVRPNPGALIVNVGDLLQAWSNDRYRSVEHRVVASAAQERFSVAFFLCPADDTIICSTAADGPRCYRSFTFREYRNQVKEDVRLAGRKIGLQRFRLLGGPL